jgi:histidine phosphotransferase ChpT
MTTSAVDLASLLCSRLCHDLLSPVGALTNGLELMADERDPEMRQRCFELFEQSARISTDKLKFFRLAFGAAGGFGGMVPVDEARSLVEALVRDNEKITVKWQLADPSLPKPAIKTLLNFALIALDALVRGGDLEIAGELRDDDSEIVVRATGNRVVFDEDIGRALEGTLPSYELSSRTAPAEMLRQMAGQLGGQLQQAFNDGELILGAVLPAK